MAYLWVLLSSRTMAPSRKISRSFKWHMTIVDSTVTPSSSTGLLGNYGLTSTTIPTKNGLTRVSGHQVSALGKYELRVVDRLFSGNAWAALGMSRVANTIKKSSFANEMTPQMNDLNAWTKEILDGVFAALVSSFREPQIPIKQILTELGQPHPRLHPRRANFQRLLRFVRSGIGRPEIGRFFP